METIFPLRPSPAVELLEHYWRDDRLLLSCKLSASNFLAHNTNYDFPSSYPSDLVRLHALLRRSYALPSPENESFLQLEPYSESAEALAARSIGTLKNLVTRYPFFFDLYSYCAKVPADRGTMSCLARLFQHHRRYDLAFSSLAYKENALEDFFPYLSSIVNRLNSFSQLDLPIIAVQAAWHWTKIEVAYNLYSRLFLRPLLAHGVSDHASRIFMYLALPQRAISVFQGLLTTHGQTIDSVPHTLLSTAVYLLVSTQYNKTVIPLDDFVSAVRSSQPPKLSSTSNGKSATTKQPRLLTQITERPSILILSPDLRYHPVGRFWMPIHRALSISSNIHCISLNPTIDSYTEEYKRLSTSFEYAPSTSLDHVQRLIRKCTPDIIIDLSGHTADNCFPVLNVRNADLQITYLGFFGPTFAAEVDYWLVDRFLEPYLWAEPDCGEKRWILPFCHLFYNPHDHRVPSSNSTILEQRFALRAPRLGSFNHTRKLSDSFIRSLSNLYARVLPTTICPLIIFKSHSFADPSVRRWFLSRLHACNIPLSAIYMLPFASSDADHFEDFRRIDIHLDSFPVCGTTTTFDALSMSTPVVTRPNGYYAGSVTAGILAAFGMNEFILGSDSDSLSPSILETLLRISRSPDFWPLYQQRLNSHLRDSPSLFQGELISMLRSKRL